MMNRKDMKLTHCNHIRTFHYNYKNIYFCGQKAMASFIQIETVTKPIYVQRNGKEICIIDCGFSWLQIAIPNMYWWLTVSFNKKDKAVNYYFDITDGNHEFYDNPYFDDMYLDVLLSDEKNFEILDREELEKALKENDINITQYHHAIKECDELVNFLSFHANFLIVECRRVYQDFKHRM